MNKKDLLFRKMVTIIIALLQISAICFVSTMKTNEPVYMNLFISFISITFTFAIIVSIIKIKSPKVYIGDDFFSWAYTSVISTIIFTIGYGIGNFGVMISILGAIGMSISLISLLKLDEAPDWIALIHILVYIAISVLMVIEQNVDTFMIYITAQIINLTASIAESTAFDKFIVDEDDK